MNIHNVRVIRPDPNGFLFRIESIETDKTLFDNVKGPRSGTKNSTSELRDIIVHGGGSDMGISKTVPAMSYSVRLAIPSGSIEKTVSGYRYLDKNDPKNSVDLVLRNGELEYKETVVEMTDKLRKL